MKISLVFVIGIFLVVGGYVLERDEDQMEDRRLTEAIREMTEELDELKASGSNSEMDEGGYDGDMMLDDDQWEMVRASVEDGSQVDKRKAIADLTKRWPNAEIPYYVNPDVESYYGTDIASVIANYEAQTCLDFIKHTTAPSGGYVNVKSGSGCASKVGYKNTNRNLFLNLGSCKPRISHEFGHAIGLKHEHERPDRDTYIQVRTENIKSGFENAFNKLTSTTINTYNVPYDYKSVMHYESDTFSSNGEPTIVSTNPMDMIDLGANTLPNFSDIKIINLMYDCSSGCSVVTCNNGGYQDNTCACVCPPGWTGSSCSTSVTLPDECKNYLTGASGSASSENYPSNYPQDHTCQWHIKGTAAGQTITVSFQDFVLEDPYGGVCDDDYLQIRTTDLFFGGDKYCGTSGPSTQVVTSSSSPPEMLIFFQSDTNTVVKKGFQFTYTIS
ncbi:protein SpAN-like [Apostichopus japonicus]|uniref:protein SpAN-like n=1 Tax=Stichopus japonicus TaxID=307972 RepID=UPI003AB41B77